MIAIFIGAGIAALAGVTIVARNASDPRPRFPQKPNQAAAIDELWHGRWGVPRYRLTSPSTWGNRAPTVDWVEGARLDFQGKGWWVTAPDGTRSSVAGLSSSALYVQVALPAGVAPADSALAHELYHQFLRLTLGNPDREHAHAEFAAEATKAAEVLRSMGL